MQNNVPEKTLMPSETEIVLEETYRKRSVFLGLLSLLTAMALALDLLIHRQGLAENWTLLLTMLVLVSALSYLAFRFLFLVQKEKVLVTTHRVAYHRISLTGRKHFIISIPLNDIVSARFFKQMLPNKPSGRDGTIVLKSRKKPQLVLPSLENGEYILETISNEMPRILTIKEGR